MTGVERVLCLVFVLITAIAFVAYADIPVGPEIRISWTPPISRINGDTMTDNEISHYDVHCWPSGEPENSNFLGTIENIGNTNTGVLRDHILQFVGKCTLNGCDFFPRALTSGFNSCAVSVVDIQGLASDFSNSVSYIVPPWPNNPNGLSD